MKARLRKVAHYDVDLDGAPAGTFKEVSQWEGFAKLQNDKGQTLIIQLPGATVVQLSDVADFYCDAEVLVVSPSLVKSLVWSTEAKS